MRLLQKSSYMKKVSEIVPAILCGLLLVCFFVKNIYGEESILPNPSARHSSIDTVQEYKFLLFGKTIEELSLSWPESKIRPYRRAIEKFPDLDSCLIAAEDADTINWSIIKTTTELEVCLSRIHTYLGDVHKSEEWFLQQGFKVIVYDYPPDSQPYRHHRVNASWLVPSSGPLKNRKAPMSGVRIFFEEFLAIAGISVGININQEGLVTHISAGYTRK